MPSVTSQKANLQTSVHLDTDFLKSGASKSCQLTVPIIKSIGKVEAVTICDVCFCSDLQCQGDMKPFKPFRESQTFSLECQALKIIPEAGEICLLGIRLISHLYC